MRSEESAGRGASLSLFGAPTLVAADATLVPVPAKTFALVAYLLLTAGGSTATRSALRHFLWENSDERTASTNLRKFLMRIRERQDKSGIDLVRTGRSHVSLAPSITIDLRRFLEAVSAQRPVDLGTLCDIYRGDLLEGFEWEDAGAREWLDVQRARLRDSFVAAVASRLEPMPNDADRMSMRVAARRLIEVDPYNETGHRTLMRLFAEEGEPARVRDVYRSLEQRLREELGVEPDLATKELHLSIAPVRASGDPPAQPLPMFRLPTAGHGAAAPLLDGGRLVADAGAAAVRNPAGTPRIVLLPPAPIGAPDFRQQLAGSLVEDITISLCRFKALSVVAPHTAWQLTASGKKELFQAFGIDYCVETHLLPARNEDLLSVQLLDAVGREILWTERFRFDREQTDRAYRDLSTRIIVSLVERIERVELSRYEVENDPTAYRLYLAGQKFAHTLDLPSVRRARRAFKLSLSTCPTFVPAISGLARTYQLEWLLTARGDGDLLAEAWRLAERSLEIDSDDSRGYRDVAICNLYAGRFDESLLAFGEAEKRNPQHADLLNDYSDALVHACQPALALEKISRAVELNPLCPDQYWWAAGGANYQLERYSDAIASMSNMRDQSPAYRLLAASWAMVGDQDRAGEYVRLAKDIHPDFSVSSWLSILPLRDPTFKELYEHGLRKAGFE